MKKLKKILIPASLIIFIVMSSTLGIVYNLQGMSRLDWVASKIEKDYKMTSLYTYGNVYLVSSDLLESINRNYARNEELLMTEDKAYKIADEFVKKYNLNEGCDYTIGVSKHDYFNINQLFNGCCYFVGIKIDKQYPDIVINNMARRKFLVHLAIDDDGVFYVEYY